MIGRSLLRAALVSAALVVPALAAACGEAEPEPSQVTFHDVGEPYQAQPFAVDPVLIAEAEGICREPEMGMVPAGAQLVVVDARGENRLLLLFGGPGVDGQCFLTRMADGRLVSEGGGSGMGNFQPDPGPNLIEDRGGGSQSSIDETGKETSLSYSAGRVGPNVVRVVAVFETGATVDASVNRGWFGLWWPGNAKLLGYRWFDGAGRLLGSSA